MALDVDFYLESVVESAAGVLQIYEKDLADSTDGYVLDIDNTLVTLLAKISYGQLLGFLNRSVALGDFIDIYSRILPDEIIQIRNFPVETVSSVLLNGETLVENEDYILEGGKYFQLIGNYGSSSDIYTQAFTKGLQGLDSQKALRITYKGGWEEAKDNPEVLAGLVLQTVGLYHRKDTLGVGSIKGASFNGSSAAGSISLSPLDPDAGGLLLSARISVERYKFYGACLTMELD